jgi:hypothetical protein
MKKAKTIDERMRDYLQQKEDEAINLDLPWQSLLPTMPDFSDLEDEKVEHERTDVTFH